MDLGNLPELVPHFFAVAANFTHTFPHQCLEISKDIWTAVRVHEAMPDGQRSFQIMKLTGSTIGLGISAMNSSLEGVAGFAIADGEALMELEKAGHQWRCTHEAPPPPQPLW